MPETLSHKAVGVLGYWDTPNSCNSNQGSKSSPDHWRVNCCVGCTRRYHEGGESSPDSWRAKLCSVHMLTLWASSKDWGRGCHRRWQGPPTQTGLTCMSTVTPVPLHCVLEKVTGVPIAEASCWVVRGSFSATVEVNLPSLHSLHFLKGGKRGFGGQPSEHTAGNTTIYLFTFTEPLLQWEYQGTRDLYTSQPQAVSRSMDIPIIVFSCRNAGTCPLVHPWPSAEEGARRHSLYI